MTTKALPGAETGTRRGSEHPDIATRRTALITGASGGIGLELTRLLAADRHDVVIVARNRERLERIAEDLRSRFQVTVRCEAYDLSEPRTAFGLWNSISAAGISIDVLVNKCRRWHVRACRGAGSRRSGSNGSIEHRRVDHADPPRPSRDATTSLGPHSQRRVGRCVSARRSAHGRLLRYEGLRAVVFEGPRARAPRHWRKCDDFVPRPDRNGVR
jgi:short chain dehydrogenase